jgi:hypothetical protein
LDSNREPATQLGQGAAAPRCRARRAPADLAVRTRSPPDAPLRPRSTASRGYAPAEAARAPRRARVSTASDRQSVRVSPARVRCAKAVSHAAITPRPGRDYLSAAIRPLHAPDCRSPPLMPPPVILQRRSLSPPADRLTLSPRTCRTSQGHALSSMRLSSPEPRAAAAAAAGRRRTPRLATSPPVPRPPIHTR